MLARRIHGERWLDSWHCKLPVKVQQIHANVSHGQYFPIMKVTRIPMDIDIEGNEPSTPRICADEHSLTKICADGIVRPAAKPDKSRPAITTSNRWDKAIAVQLTAQMGDVNSTVYFLPILCISGAAVKLPKNAPRGGTEPIKLMDGEGFYLQELCRERQLTRP
jgi:hypothetical protein